MIVRHLAASYNGERIAVAEFERHVAIWDLKKGEKICDFETILDFGGTRLAISEDGTICAAGAYQKYGVAGYRASNGELLWERRDLTKVQFLRFSTHREHSLFACFDDRPCHMIEGENGQTIQTFLGVEKVTESPFQPLGLLSIKKAFRLHDFRKNRVVATIPKVTFADLDSTFTEDAVVVTESAGPVSAYSLRDGKLLWRYVPEEGNRIVWLTYCEKLQEVIGVNVPHTHKGNEMLLYFNKHTGSVTHQLELGGRPLVEFAFRGSHMVISHGDIMNTISQKTKHLDF